MPPITERPIVTDRSDEHRGLGFEATQFGVDGVQPFDPFDR